MFSASPAVQRSTILSIPQYFPKTRPHFQSEHAARNTIQNIYTVGVAMSIHDPSIVSTPPSEFINTLKDRMNVYFPSGAK